MIVTLKLNSHLTFPDKPIIYELNNVNLKNKVQELRIEVTKKINIEQDKYELTYCGCILEDELSLESYGLKSGVTVHIMPKKESINVPNSNSLTYIAIIRLAFIFTSLNENEAKRSAFERFSARDDFNDNLMEAIPDLKTDLVSVAIVNDPILMLHFTDYDTVKRASEHHPALIRVAHLIAAAVQEELEESPSTDPIAGSSYMNVDPRIPMNVNNTNEIESMDSSQPSEPTTPQPSAVQTPLAHSITSIQLAAALASARPNPSRIAPSSSTNRTPNFPRITLEMFSQAMQQVYDSHSGNSTGAPVTPVTPVSPMTPQSQTQNIQSQLNLMHEMGLIDDTINIQALQFTNGNVQAAIELVFSGFGDN